MISISKSGNGVKFTFDENNHYLQNGTIEVPLNSLTLVTDESDMATFKKSATNDIFISALYSDFGMTKSELESFYKENMVGSSGIDSGAVETIVEEYMTDPNYFAYSAVTGQFYIGTNGHSKFYPFGSDKLLIRSNSIASNGYVVPASDTNGIWGGGDYYLYIHNIQTSSEFRKYINYGFPDEIPVLLFAIDKEYSSVITQVYKNEKIWYGFNEIPTKPKNILDIDGIVKDEFYDMSPTTYDKVSGCTYLVMNVFQTLNPYSSRPLGLANPLDFSGIDFSEDYSNTRVYISCDGTPDVYGHTIGYYLMGMSTTEGYFVMPLANNNNLNKYWEYTNVIQPLIYDLTMDKQYEASNFTDLYNKVGSAQTSADSAQTTANRALLQANTNKANIIQADWNQNNSGSTNYDYIKNRPFYTETFPISACCNEIIDDEIWMHMYGCYDNTNPYTITATRQLNVGNVVSLALTYMGDMSNFLFQNKEIMQGDGYMYTDSENGIYISSSDNGATWTLYTYSSCCIQPVLILNESTEIIHKLDSKYIDDDIARTSDIPTVPTSNTAFTNDAGYITSGALSGKVETSAITTSVTSASTDSEIPTAKAVFDAIPSGSTGGMDDDMERLISTALVDLNDRKIDVSEVKSKYQIKGNYATKSQLNAKANTSEVMTLEKAEENELVTATALNQLNNRITALEEAIAELQALHNNG